MTGYILSRLIQLLLAAVGLCHADSFPISAPVLQRTRHGAESPRIYCSFSMHGAAAALGAHKLMLGRRKDHPGHQNQYHAYTCDAAIDRYFNLW